MPEKPPRELIRHQIGELLTVLADAEAQRQYERSVPLANVPAALVCVWFDDLYSPDDDTFRSAFSATELDTLGEIQRRVRSRRSGDSTSAA